MFEYAYQRYMRIRHRLAVVVKHTKRAFEMRGGYFMRMVGNVRCTISMYAYAHPLRQQKRQDQPYYQNTLCGMCKHGVSVMDVRVLFK